MPGKSWKNWLACPDRIGNRPMMMKPITRINSRNINETAVILGTCLAVSFAIGPSSI